MTCWRDCRLCAAACSATAKFLSLNAPQAKEMIRIMVDCCSKCAEECEQHAKHGSVHCGDCAAACKKCVEAFKGETVKGSI